MQDIEGRIRELLATWGWSLVPDELREHAEQTLRIEGARSGDIPVILGYCSEEEKERALNAKPPQSKTLDYLCDELARVRPHRLRMLAMIDAIPFIDTLPDTVTPHPVMDREEVREACRKLEIALTEIEGAQPMIIFSDHDRYIEFRQMGREQVLKNPIYGALRIRRESDARPTFALGSPAVVFPLLSQSNEGESRDHGSVKSRVWYSQQDNDREVKRLLKRIIDRGILADSADIAILPRHNGGGKLLYRLNGRMQSMDDMRSIPAEEMLACVRFLATISGANPEGTRMREPRDGQVLYRSNAGNRFIRLNFIPLSDGSDVDRYSVSLRLLPHERDAVDLEGLGLNERVLAEARHAIRHFKSGLIIVCGPTGQGKSTTIAGMISDHVAAFGDQFKRVSLEDPVERILPGITQFPVPMVEGGFGLMLRALLRHDPDLIWQGEIRDRESAETCVRAASTGHLVLSTVHAKTAGGAIQELMSKVDEDQRVPLIDSLVLVLSQRLVPRICSSCGPVWRDTTDEDRRNGELYGRRYGVHVTLPDRVPDKGAGCQDCNHTGLGGVLPVNEALPITPEAQMAFLSSSLSEQMQASRDFVTSTLYDTTMPLIIDGKTPLESLWA